MAKRKRQAQRQTGIQKTENFPANNMNEKMLTSIITNALLEYDKRKEQEAQEKAETEQASFTQRVGYKDYSAEKQPKRIIKSFFNRAKVFFNILFMRSRNIKGTRATFLPVSYTHLMRCPKARVPLQKRSPTSVSGRAERPFGARGCTTTATRLPCARFVRQSIIF